MIFEVDPEWTDRARAKFGVNKIIASVKKPADWLTETEPKFNNIEIDDLVSIIHLGRRWEKDIPRFFEELAGFRSKYNNLSQ